MPTIATADGARIDLGSDAKLAAVLQDMTAATGGSSARGAWSHLFGLGTDLHLSTDDASRLAHEAGTFLVQCRDLLTQPTRDLLEQLSQLR